MNKKEDEPTWKDKTYARIPRAWGVARIEGRLSADELLILLWLALGANPHNGTIKTSYEEIVSDLAVSGKNPKNRINKAMLSLKEKQYLWYPVQKGRRSSFVVEIAGYLLSTKNPKDISYRFVGNGSRSSADVLQTASKGNEEDEQHLSTSKAIHDARGQKSENFFHESIFDDLASLEDTHSRSTNNDKDNNNNNNKEVSITYKKGNSSDFLKEKPSPDVIDYFPRSLEEQECRGIALSLGEQSMNFILAKLKSHGIEKIKQAYSATISAVEKGDFRGNQGAYFNKVLQLL